MEEQVGLLWHKLVTSAARRHYHPDAAVPLASVQHSVGVLFRACGGDSGLRVEAANPVAHGGRRRWLQRLAGTGARVALASRDAQALRLPAEIALFADPGLNRDLYLWLSVLAAKGAPEQQTWWQDNQCLTRRVLDELPGLRRRYQRLVAAYLPTRMQPAELAAGEGRQEAAIRQALLEPGSVLEWPETGCEPQPVHLWLQPASADPEDGISAAMPAGDEPSAGQSVEGDELARRRQAQRVESPERNRGLLALRFESIFGWAQYLKVDRGTEENDDMSEAKREADDMEVLSVARDNRATVQRIRFDLDLPAGENDDLPLGEGVFLPEWDHRQQRLVEQACIAKPMVSAHAEARSSPAHLKSTVRKLREQFLALLPARTWQRAQAQGQEIDLDAYLQDRADWLAGARSDRQRWYRDLRSQERDLACLLLADLSLSTDSWVDDEQRVIDVIRDSLFVFSEVLAVTNDRFALWGFSSRRRADVRMHQLKAFSESPGARVNGRIAAIKPGFYTRMGAAIRFASRELEAVSASRRLLLILTDGKPNDLDHYEGRYGIEDTRMALREARRKGLVPFCITIDEKAKNYLPHLFGSNGYVLIRKPAELVHKLPLLYAQLSE